MSPITSARRKGLIGGLTAGTIVLMLVVVPALLSPNGDNSAQACDPYDFTDARLDQVFHSRPGCDGHSWGTAYHFTGNMTSGWTFDGTTRYVIIQDCFFGGTAWGIRLEGASHVRVINCTFTDCTRGIWARRSSDIAVQDSTFAADVKGTDLWGCSNISITRNGFWDDGTGILMDSSCSNTLVKYNQFASCASAADVGSPVVTFTGNFFGDYFEVYPAGTLDTTHPDLGYCPPSQGTAFPLSVPVSLGHGMPFAVDPSPLWFVHHAAPTITITSPMTGSCWRTPPTLVVALGGTLLGNASYTLGGCQFPIPLPSTPCGTGSTSVVVDAGAFGPLGEGPFAIMASVTSWFNDTSSTTVACMKDTIAPVVTLVSPANNSSHAAPPTINLTVTDASPCGASYTIAGTSRAVSLPTFSITAADWANVSEGAVSILLTVTDAAGNTARCSVILLKDVSGPSISAHWVTGTNLAGVIPPALVATAADPAGVPGSLQYSAGGVYWTVAPGISTTIPTSAYAAIPDGSFAVTITAWDSLGNPAAILLEGTKDTVFDSLEVLAPIAGAVVSDAVVPYFAIRAIDGAGVVSRWVSLDGGSVRYSIGEVGYLPAGAWADAVAAPGDIVSITFGATDAAGNNATVTVQVSVVASSGGHGNDGGDHWWYSPLFWAGSTFGLLCMAIIVAISFGSATRSRNAPKELSRALQGEPA